VVTRARANRWTAPGGRRIAVLTFAVLALLVATGFGRDRDDDVRAVVRRSQRVPHFFDPHSGKRIAATPA
jgi:hypothetical protein